VGAEAVGYVTSGGACVGRGAEVGAYCAIWVGAALGAQAESKMAKRIDATSRRWVFMRNLLFEGANKLFDPTANRVAQEAAGGLIAG
jgi:hypothetical protein